MSKIDKELAKYLVKLALTNPQQVFPAMLEILNQRMAQRLTGQVAKIVEKSWNELDEQFEKNLNEFEEQLRKIFDVGNNNDKGGLH